MTLGDVYGRVNKSGNEKGVNAVTRSSEDGSDKKEEAPTGPALALAHKRAEIVAMDKETATLRRKLVNEDLHKSTDPIVFRRVKAGIEGKLKQIEMEKHRVEGEIRHLESASKLSARRHL